MGYVADYSQKIVGETFTCYRMEKQLNNEKSNMTRREKK